MQKLLFHEIHQKSRLSIKEVNEALKEFELYSAQWSILFCLSQFGPMTQKEIWQYMNVEAPTVTRTLARMEQSGWIVRKEGPDKRKRIVCLSAKAEQTVPEIETKISGLEKQLLAALTEQEQEMLMGLIKKIGMSRKKEKDVHNG